MKKLEKVSRKFLLGVAEITAVLSFTGTILAFGEKYYWILGLFSNLRVQYFILLLISLIIFSIAKRKIYISIAVLGLIINAIYIYPASINEEKQEYEEQITVATFNVYTGNKREKEVIDYVLKNNIDIILFLEINNRWNESLKAIKETFPYAVTRPREDNFGIVLYSKYPIIKEDIINLTDTLQGVPTIYAKVKLNNGDINVIGTHPLPPISKEYEYLRNEQLTKLAEFLKDKQKSSILMGDFNATPWSYYMLKFLDESNYQDSNPGIFRATWNKYHPLFAIPLDYIMTSKDIRIISHFIGNNIGSDHSLVKAKVSIPYKKND